MRWRANKGFTLVELIVVLVITGIIAAMVGVFIVSPVQGYLDQSRRAELVDVAEMSLQRMAREVRSALPNSIRTSPPGSGTTLELISVKDAGRYRRGPGTPPVGGTPDRRLQFNQDDTSFNLVGPRQPAMVDGDRLVVFNLGQDGADAYAGDAVISPVLGANPVAPDGDVDDEYRVTMPAHQFALESPGQRLYVVDGAVAYVCDGNGNLLRFTRSAQNIGAGITGSGSLVASGVSNCLFSYDPGTATRNAVVTMELVLEREGERVRLLRQVHVENVP